MAESRIPPSLLARVDQWQADCDHVIGMVRAHRDFDCNALDGPCIGEQAMARLMTLSRGEAITMLCCTLTRLADQPTTIEGISP